MLTCRLKPILTLDKPRKKDFPVLQSQPELTYLDSAATTLLPQVVINAQQAWYEKKHAPIHRSIYQLAVTATEKYEAVREKIERFVQAASSSEIIFTHNATEGLNLVAFLEEQRLQKNDEIILSYAEHHSNMLPWQRVAQRTGAKIIWLPAHEDGYFPLKALEKTLSAKTRLVTVSHVSNVLGYIAPLKEISTLVRSLNARLVVDAAQSIPVTSIDVRDVDYAVFSGHKLYAPEGTGFVYARSELLENIEPLLVGGGAIAQVTPEKTTWATNPHRFEAGSPHSAGVIGLGAALGYLELMGLAKIQQHLQDLTTYGLEKLSEIEQLTLYGPTTAKNRAPIFSFSIKVGNKNLHSHDICQLADAEGVALRGGHHCAQPLMEALGVTDLTRASCGIYTTKQDIDHLVDALWTSIEKLS